MNKLAGALMLPMAILALDAMRAIFYRLVSERSRFPGINRFKSAPRTRLLSTGGAIAIPQGARHRAS